MYNPYADSGYSNYAADAGQYDQQGDGAYYAESGEYGYGDYDASAAAYSDDVTGSSSVAASEGAEGWYSINSTNVSLNMPGSIPLSATCFDHYRELLWSGSFSGHLISSHHDSLDKRTQFRAHSSSILSMHSLANGIFSLSQESARFHSRGGAMRAEFYTPKLINLSTSCLPDPSEPFLFLSSRGSGIERDTSTLSPESRFGVDSSRPAIGSLDLVHSNVRREVNTDAAYTGLVRSRFLLGAREDGSFDVRDPRSLRLENTLSAHAGAISSIDCRGDLVVTCGFSSAPSVVHPHPRIEPFIKVFDLRMMRQLAPIVFSTGGGPAFLKFHPFLASSLLVSSYSGTFQFVDPESGVPDIKIYQLDTPYDSSPLLTALDFSATGECLSFVDNLGFVHEWSSNAGLSSQPQINAYSAPIEDVEYPAAPVFEDSELQSFSKSLLQPISGSSEYCQTNLPFPVDSEWLEPLGSFTEPGSILLTPDFVQPPVDISLFKEKDIKWNDYIGVVSFGKHGKKKVKGKGNASSAAGAGLSTPNQGSHHDPLVSESSEEEDDSFVPNCLATLKQFAGQGRNTEKIFKKRNFLRSLADLLHSPSRNDLLVSKEYARVSIKIPKFGLYAFDFTQFNQTQFTGLDNFLPNSYVNASLQMLYFLRSLRFYFLSHNCERENCLTCELGFLFHMFEKSAGSTAEPRNLLRALRSIPEAGGLNLLDDTIMENNPHQMQLGIRIQDFFRFLVEQLNKEEWIDKRKRQEELEYRLNQARIYFDLEKQKNHRALNFQLSQLQMNLQNVSARLQQIQQQMVLNANNPQFQRNSALQAAQQLMAQQANLIKQIQANQIESQKVLNAQFQPGDEFAGLEARSMTEKIFGFSCLQSLNCANSHYSVKETPFLSLKLVYSPQMHRGTTFGELLRNSLQESSSRRLWCENCSQYQWTQQAKSLVSFPFVLSIAANVQTDAELEIWRFNRKKKSDNRQRIRIPGGLRANLMEEFEDAADGAGNAGIGGGGRAKRFAARSREEDIEEDDGDDDAADGSDYNWLPQYLRIEIDTQNGQTIVKRRTEKEAREEAKQIADEERIRAMQQMQIGNQVQIPQPPVRSAVYELIGVISHISDPPEKDSPLNVTNGEHLVAHIKVAQDDLAAHTASAMKSWKDRWFVFNDFVIRKSSAGEATRFTYQWKQPSLLFYSCMAPAEAPQTTAPRHPFAAAPIHYQPSLSLRSSENRSFTPLQSNESMGKGALVAIDCEFVSVQPELTEFDAETGENVVVRPSRLTLARVSVVRGEGPLVGVPFIDDYIATSEAVVDYLTPFSGLVAGDLDRSISPHHLTTLKQAYIRLRTLVDRGVIFIGHGLKKDFQMINIVVPPSQIQDTVEIYSLPNQRKLGLRFLARYVLNVNIQEDAHDSIEDSRTALALVKKYESIMKLPNGQQQFQQLLRQLYDIGHKAGFKV